MTCRFQVFDSIPRHPVGAPNDGAMSDLKMINGEIKHTVFRIFASNFTKQINERAQIEH